VGLPAHPQPLPIDSINHSHIRPQLNVGVTVSPVLVLGVPDDVLFSSEPLSLTVSRLQLKALPLMMFAGVLREG